MMYRKVVHVCSESSTEDLKVCYVGKKVEFYMLQQKVQVLNMLDRKGSLGHKNWMNSYYRN
jgi:hypothetical protein